jgi:predicted DNA-binding transcriptional regulator AlpA
MNLDQKFLKEAQVAHYFKLSVWKLRKDRENNRGLPYVKIGRLVRYPVEKIEQFLEDNKVLPKN